MNENETANKEIPNEVKEYVDGSKMGMFYNATKSFLIKNLLPGVVYLDLSGNHIDEECSKILANHLSSPDNKINSLSIENCQLTYKCNTIIFNAIGDSHVYELYVDGNILSIENCLALGQSLSKNPPLKFLSLVGCQINSVGFIQLFSGLPKSQNLRNIRFDSNTMLDSGATAFADLIPILKLESLGISDNELWREGTTQIIQSCILHDTIFMFDIGYNIIDLNVLSDFVQKSKRLTHLCISGAKIREEQLNNFLHAVGRSKISTLLIEGLNFHDMSISWGKATENAFSGSSHFDALIHMINTNTNLNDLRLGFLDIDQLYGLYNERNPNWKFTLSLHDFGKTGNTWLITFPDYVVESPVPKFTWNSKIINTPYVNTLNIILRNVNCKGKPIRNIDLHGIKMNDESFGKFFTELENDTYSEINLSNNDIRSCSMDAMIEFLKKPNSYIEKLYLLKSKSNATNLLSFFEFLNANFEKCPKVLHIKFDSSKQKEEGGVHEFSTELGQLIGKNPALVDFRLSGQMTGKDANNIIAQLKNNHNLRNLELQSAMFDRYHSADPDIDESIQNVFNDFIETFSHALLDEDTQCTLEQFSFPLLTELFLGFSPNIKLWPTILRQIETNYNTNRENAAHP